MRKQEREIAREIERVSARRKRQQERKRECKRDRAREREPLFNYNLHTLVSELQASQLFLFLFFEGEKKISDSVSVHMSDTTQGQELIY